MSASGSLVQRAGRSALWQLAGGGWQTFVRLGSSVILARQLTPEDFGVFGMALLMREFIFYLGNMGMDAGIIARKDVSEEDLCTCFWSMAAVRAIMFVIAFSFAPLGAWFFNDERVTDVVRVISFTFLFSSMGSVANALLSKALKHKALNILTGVLAVVESSLAVALALATDLGYWGLVIAMLVHAFLYQSIMFYLSGWRPKLKFSRDSFRYLFRYGINGLGFNIANYLKLNLDYLLVGRLLGTASLGLYEFAYRIPHLVQARISRPVGAVVFPALSQVQDDNQKLAKGYIEAVKYVSLITFPLLFGLAAVADVAVPVLWGDQWLAIIVPLQILCCSALLRVLFQSVQAIFICKNRPDLPFKISVVELFWTASVVGVLGYHFAIVGVAIGMLLSVFPSFVSIYIAFRLIDAKVLGLYQAISSVFVSALVCGVAAYASITYLSLAGFDDLYALIISIAVGALCYLLCIFVVFPRLGRDMFKVLETVRGKKFSLRLF